MRVLFVFSFSGKKSSLVKLNLDKGRGGGKKSSSKERWESVATRACCAFACERVGSSQHLPAGKVVREGRTVIIFRPRTSRKVLVPASEPRLRRRLSATE